MHLFRLILLPIGWIYSMIVFFRNRLFDAGVLTSQSGVLPTIVIGNLTSGGTGKTPHAIFIMELLKSRMKIAFLSRGYRRKTSGFILSGKKDNFLTIGDEPSLIHQRFPDIPVAVCEDRLTGINELKKLTDSSLIILDDAFQHRRLKGDLNILLTDYHRPYWKDFPLPAGNLRDNKYEKRRAQIIVVTKCPPELQQREMDQLISRIQPTENQNVFFSTLKYSSPIRLSGPEVPEKDLTEIAGFAGLASTTLFEQHLKETRNLKKFKAYPDHYIFSQSDIQILWNECGNFAAALFTTEKDAARLRSMAGIEHIPIYYIPVEVRLLGDEQVFEKVILSALTHRK